MADKSSRAKNQTGGPGSAAITNDDSYTYEEEDNGYDDYIQNTVAKTKDDRSF